MPITPHFTWRECPSSVTIDVALRSVSPSSIDILTTDCYVKVNCSPYLFQADLFGEIKSDKSSAIIDKDLVKFLLVKKKEGLWGRLNAIGEKKDTLLKREKSLESARQHAQKLKEEAKAKIARIGRLAVENQMKLDEAKRKTISVRKEAELKQERDEIQLWQEDLKTNQGSEYYESSNKKEVPFRNGGWIDHKNIPIPHSKCNLLEDIHCQSLNKSSCHEDMKGAIFKESKSEKTNVEQEEKLYSCPETIQDCSTNVKYECNDIPQINLQNHLFDSQTKILPAPRKSIYVSVKFSPKTLPPHLPARESRDKVHLKESNPISSDAIDISERDPLFLQDKGDQFYRTGDFRSAINAYTDAVGKDSSMVLCFANRAACHLQMNQFNSCIEDCMMALKLLQKREFEASQEGLQPIATASIVSNKQAKDIMENKAEINFIDSNCIQERNTLKKESIDIEILRLLIQESLQLLTYKLGHDNAYIYKETHVTAWNEAAKRRVLVRCGSARYHLRDMERSVIDFAKALSMDPASKEMERVFLDVQKLFNEQGGEGNITLGA